MQKEEVLQKWLVKNYNYLKNIIINTIVTIGREVKDQSSNKYLTKT